MPRASSAVKSQFVKRDLRRFVGVRADRKSNQRLHNRRRSALRRRRKWSTGDGVENLSHGHPFFELRFGDAVSHWKSRPNAIHKFAASLRGVRTAAGVNYKLCLSWWPTLHFAWLVKMSQIDCTTHTRLEPRGCIDF